MSGYPFDSARQLQMRKQFEKAERLGREMRGRPDALKQHERIDRVLRDQQKHIERHKPIWVAKEFDKLVAEHRGKLKPTLSPKYVLQTETSPAALAQRAIWNVENRIENKMQRTQKAVDRLRVKFGLSADQNQPKPKMKI